MIPRRVEHGSPEYDALVALRREVLRTPLGLDFTPEELAGERDQIHLGLFEGGTPVACAVVIPDAGKVRQVAVRPDRQGRGLGAAIMREAEGASARRRGEAGRPPRPRGGGPLLRASRLRGRGRSVRGGRPPSPEDGQEPREPGRGTDAPVCAARTRLKTSGTVNRALPPCGPHRRGRLCHTLGSRPPARALRGGATDPSGTAGRGRSRSRGPPSRGSGPPWPRAACRPRRSAGSPSSCGR